MAEGDVKYFDEAKAYMQDSGWLPTDDIKIAVLDNTTTPAAGDATPALGDYTEVGTAGSYTAGGISVGTWGDFITEAAGVVKYDSATNPSWVKDAANDVDAWWGLAYNDTQAGDPALFFVELDGPLDMTKGALAITWNAAGVATLT